MDPNQLIALAQEAAGQAYAPYSGYAVGAAVETEAGAVHTGCNVENRSYGLTVCAERVAIAAAVSSGAREIRALAVHTRDGAAPCGACRQVLLEFGNAETRVYVMEEGALKEWSLAELLPQAFNSPL